MTYEQRIKWFTTLKLESITEDDILQIVNEMVFMNDLVLKFKDECGFMMGRAMKAELIAAKGQ